MPVGLSITFLAFASPSTGFLASPRLPVLVFFGTAQKKRRLFTGASLYPVFHRRYDCFVFVVYVAPFVQYHVSIIHVYYLKI